MLTFTLVLAAAVFAIPAPVAQVVSCAMQGHVITCPVDVGLSAPLPFVVDTGTRRTVIDPAVAVRLGLSATPSSIIALGANVASGDVLLPFLRFGSLSRVALRASVCDLRALRASTGVRAAGILGMDVLDRTSLTIDYRRSRVTIGTFGPLAHRMPLVRTSEGFAAVEVEMGDQRLRLVLDTGADGVLVFATPVLTSVIGWDSVEAAGLWGASRLATVRVGPIRLAEWRLQTDTVAVTAGVEAKHAYGGDGLLGVRSLGAALVSLDFAHGELRWER